jgi:hypothetical protein
MKLAATAVFLGLAPLAACATDPQYIQPPLGIEVGTGAPDDMGVATATLLMPYDAERLNSVDYQRDREAFLTELNARVDPDVTIDQLPLIRLDQIDISIEWTIRNLSEEPGEARINVNGGNQYFIYLPDNFIVADEEEEAVPPPLAGNVPIDVPALGDISGVFREDQIREAALDLDLITRGLVNPFAALLINHEDIKNTSEIEFSPYPPDQDPPPAPPPPMPIEIFAQFVQFDVTFTASQHMILEYSVRVRDPDGVLHDELLDAPPEELMVFAPAIYVPPVAAP